MMSASKQATARTGRRILEEIRRRGAAVAFVLKGRSLIKYRRLGFLGLAVIVCVSGYFAYDHASRAKQLPRAAQAQGIPVSAISASQINFPVLLSGLGTVQAFNTVTVRSRVDGEITNIAFKEGDIVKAGDLLAQIDSRPYRAAADQAIAKK